MSSGVTKIDLQALIDFRKKLREHSTKVVEQERKTKHAMDIVSRSWHDENFKEFESKFMQDVDTIKKLIEKLNQFDDPVLRRFQIKIERYLEIKY